MRPGEKRKERSRREAYELLKPVKQQLNIDCIIQCGLGDWAEGPVLLDMFPDVRYMAVEPIHRYCHEAWAAGFRGPILQGLLWNQTGLEKTLNDWRTETSVFDEADHGLGTLKARTVTLDDAVEWVGFPKRSCLLWMDCEGAELEILRGAEQTLKSVEAVMCELKQKAKFAGWAVADSVIATLASLGFAMERNSASNGLFLRAVVPG